MKIIKPAEVNGAMVAQPSKSIMQRALIIASLANGESVISNSTFCDDAKATINVIKALGAEVSLDIEKKLVKVLGGRTPRNGTLDCGESGTCLRMISAVASLYGKRFTITGKGSLLSRPVHMIEKPLQELGAKCTSNNGTPPLEIKGPIHGGKISIDGSETSQFASGLLMALPLCKEDSQLEIINSKSTKYIHITEWVMDCFGLATKTWYESIERISIHGGQRYQPRRFMVDGDWSGAAFMLVAGAIAGSVVVNKLRLGFQPDQEIRNVLELAGANIVEDNNKLRVQTDELNCFEFDATNCPDLFPPLAVLACNCKGKSMIYGTERLKHKESDRASALVKELGKMGAKIKVVGNRMEIHGKKLKGGATIDPHNDHRIAMACAIAALNSEKPVKIKNPGCVSKSYPNFFEDLELLMVKK